MGLARGSLCRSRTIPCPSATTLPPKTSPPSTKPPWTPASRSAAGDWEATSEEIEAATAALADAEVDLPPEVVVDVGRMAVVEANPAWASGLCGCDPAGVLPVLRRAAVPHGAVPEAERRWVRRASRLSVAAP